MTTEERVLVEDILTEYKSYVDYIKGLREQGGGILNFFNYPECDRREAKIDGIRQSLSSILKCRIHEWLPMGQMEMPMLIDL